MVTGVSNEDNSDFLALTFLCSFFFIYHIYLITCLIHCRSYIICSQTYTRKVDTDCLAVLASLGGSVHKVSLLKIRPIKILFVSDFRPTLLKHVRHKLYGFAKVELKNAHA